MVRIPGFHSCSRDSIPSCGTEILEQEKIFSQYAFIKNFYCKYMTNSQNSILRKQRNILNGQEIFFLMGKDFKR